MNVLVKLPSRERPARLQDAVLAMLNKATFRPNFLFAVDPEYRSRWMTMPYYWLNTRRSRSERSARLQDRSV